MKCSNYARAQYSGVIAGTISLPQGNTAIKTGSWIDNQLTFTAETPNGKINFVGTLRDGELVGSYEQGGQPGGKWRATRKSAKPE